MTEYSFEIVAIDGNVYDIRIQEDTQFNAMRRLVEDDLWSEDSMVIGYEELRDGTD